TLSASQRARLASVHQRDEKGALAPIEFGLHEMPEFLMGGGGLNGTAPDYLAFAQMILHGGRFNGAQVLRPETVDHMAQNHIGPLEIGAMMSAMPSLSHDIELFPGMSKKWKLNPHFLDIPPLHRAVSGNVQEVGVELPDQHGAIADGPGGGQSGVGGPRQHVLLDRPEQARVRSLPLAGAAVLRPHGDRPADEVRDRDLSRALSPRSALLPVLDVTAIGLVVTDEKGLERGRELLSIEGALLIGLHICGALPETHGKPGILVGRIL